MLGMRRGEVEEWTPPTPLDKKGNRAQFEAAMQFGVGALMGLLIWWLDNDFPYSVEKIAQGRIASDLAVGGDAISALVRQRREAQAAPLS